MTNYEFLKQNEVKGLVTCKDTKTGSECIVHSILAEYFNEAEKAVKVYSESQGYFDVGVSEFNSRFTDLKYEIS